MPLRMEALRRAALLTFAAGLVAGLTAGAGGCAKLPRDAAAVTGSERLWALHRTRVEGVSSWQLVGEVGIRRAGWRWRAGLSWLHDQTGDRVDLLEPGGRVLMRLHGRADGADATDGKGRVYRAGTFEELVAAVIGVEVPVSSLRHWVAGVPDPRVRVTAMRVDRNGRMQELEQRGWRVNYLHYRPVAAAALSALELPSLLTLNREGLEVTVATSRWRLLDLNPAVERTI